MDTFKIFDMYEQNVNFNSSKSVLRGFFSFLIISGLTLYYAIMLTYEFKSPKLENKYLLQSLEDRIYTLKQDTVLNLDIEIKYANAAKDLKSCDPLLCKHTADNKECFKFEKGRSKGKEAFYYFFKRQIIVNKSSYYLRIFWEEISCSQELGASIEFNIKYDSVAYNSIGNNNKKELYIKLFETN